ncbi:MAG: S8 family serine peptidase [Chloroflexi bacterium]|nr:S8 family serine peptidase [Chloroflexota bacterium]
MQQRLWLILVTLLATMGLISAAFALNETTTTRQPIATAPDDISLVTSDNPTKQAARDLPQPHTYIIVLADAPLASYADGKLGFAATSPAATGDQRLDMTSVNGRSYHAYLTAVQNNLLHTLSVAYGHTLTPFYQFTVALNGITVQLSAEEAEAAAKMPGVTAVIRDEWHFPTTDATPAFIGATALWDGSATGGLPGTKGDGVIVGVIDTGIWPEHPSFTDDGSYPPPPDFWGGYCQPPADGQNYYFCNDKLIGAQFFLEAYVAAMGGTYNGDFHSARDDNGHGTHTASTAAGNENVPATLLGIPRGTVSGIAPRAYVSAYKALGPYGGLTSDLVAAIDRAVADGVDVINYSIGGSSRDPWQELTALAFLNARAAGVFAAVSAGNSGPGASTVASPGDAPWVTTVAASTSNRQYLSDITITPTISTTVPLYGATLTGGVTDFVLVDAADYTDTLGQNGRLCLNPFAPGTFAANEVVLCERGINARVDKGVNVDAGGAGGLILANAEPGDLATDPYPLPAVHVDAAAGALLRQHIADQSPVTVSFTGSTAVLAPDPRVPVDQMAAFSSRGPIQHGGSNYVKPSITGPGVQILAGQTPFANGAPTGALFQAISGTSMSSPHVAGAAALLVALHPDWSPAEIESALMTTSNPNHLKHDGVTQADAFDMGAGRLDLFVASKAGLVLHEETSSYPAANPAAGGNPAELNIASLANSQCLAECSWQRTVRSTLPYTVTWTAVVPEIAGIDLTITPTQFDIAPGQSQTLTISANVEQFAPDGAWHFVSFALQPDDTDVPQAHFPIALLPTSSILVDRVLETSHFKDGRVDVPVIARQISDLTLTPVGLTIGDVTTANLLEDPTPEDPFDNLNDGTTFFITMTVPADALRLVAETTESTATDMDLFVGTGDTPSAQTQVCNSTSPHPMEYCHVPNPAAGIWWVLVQNWQESDNAPDLAVLITAVVSNDNGNVNATGPATVPAGQPFAVTVNWQKEALTPGDRAYGAVVMGTDAAHTDNVGVINLDIVYTGAALVSLSSNELDISQGTNQVHTHTLTISNPGDIALNWTVSQESAASQITLDLAGEAPVGEAPVGEDSVADPTYFQTIGSFAPFSQMTNPNPPATAWSANQPSSGQTIALTLDDGSPETSFGANGREFIWLNRFTPRQIDYPFALTTVQILFDATALTGVQVGELVDIYVYQDADGNPNSGAVHVGSIHNAPVQFANGTDFSTYQFDQPLRLTGPGDVLIAVVNRTAGIASGGYPAAMDATSSRQRSWIGLYSAGAPADPPTIPADQDWGLVDTFGAPGNWMIRGFGEKCGAADIDWLSVSPTSGVTAPGGSSDLALTVDTQGLEDGVYTAVLCLDSNAITDGSEPFIRVPITVTVAPQMHDYDIFLPFIIK